jgi:hypothetical protein
MKKIFFILFAVNIASSLCCAQTFPLPTLPSGWERIYISNVGSFDLPSTMEIQAGKYKQAMNAYYKRMEYETPDLVAQQKKLNEYNKNAFEKYARVMIQTTIGKAGDYEKLNFNISAYGLSDITELNSTFKQQIKESFVGTGLVLVEWYPLKVEKVNGMSCIHISYTRRLQDNPLVLVHIFYFHNNDRMHTFTLSYRISEADYWKTDYATILKSFRITNNK